MSYQQVSQIKRIKKASLVNPYTVLNIRNLAPIEEIKISIKKFMLLLHPDRIENIDLEEDAKEAFHKIIKCKAILLDSKKKIELDNKINFIVKYKISSNCLKSNKEKNLIIDEHLKNLENVKYSRESSNRSERFSSKYLDKEDYHDNKAYYWNVNRRRNISNEEIEFYEIFNDIEKKTKEKWEKDKETRMKNWNRFSKSKKYKRSRIR